MAEVINVVAGSYDNVQPVWDPSRGFRLWALREIFDGTIGANRFVPNLDDRVLDTQTEVTYKVTSIDPVSFKSTLQRVSDNGVDIPLEPDDVLLGVGPGPQSNTFRAYLNDKVIPYDMVVEQRCFVWAARAKYARVMRGGFAGGASKVISAVYDASGNLVGQDVPLELAEIMGNRTRKTVVPFKCTEKIPDGEPLYVAFFTDDNILLSKRQVLVENTDFITAPNTALKYVTDVYLDTPFLSNSDTTLIQYPINVLMQGLNLLGVVKYSDGTTVSYPIDGSKFSLFGLEDYVLTVPGEEVKLVLNYNLSSDEIAYDLPVGENRNVTKNYRARTLVENGSYSVKLFAYPVWLGEIDGYRLEWFLANLERTSIWRVTPNVRFESSSRSFTPREYGTTQRLAVSLDLQSVNATFNKYKHIQTIDVTLLRPAIEPDTNWTVGFEPSQNPPFGVANYAESTFIDTNNWRVNLGMGLTVFDEWLDRLYYRTLPLFDSQKESKAPAPTHFALVFNNRSIEFPIAEWKTLHTISEAVPNASTLFVRFFKRTADNDIQLSIAGLPVRQTV
jgi:hypothetical protein